MLEATNKPGTISSPHGLYHQNTSTLVKPPIPLARPYITDEERAAVAAVLDSDVLARGPRIDQFEERMAAYCQTKHAIAVSSGTAALHLLVRSARWQPGDEVITTPFSFVASTNVLLYEGVQPRFVDIDPKTYNVNTTHVPAACSERTRGILAVDVFGYPAHWPWLTGFAEDNHLTLVADACESLGATVNERPCGSWGIGAAFGFYPNKQITTGEGGCITTNSDDVAAFCRSLRNQGRTLSPAMEHTELGYNYRMSELSAALGNAQLKRLPELLERRTQVANWYNLALRSLQPDLILPCPDTPQTKRSWFAYVIQLHTSFAPDARDHLQAALQAEGIGCSPYFPCIHLQPYYRRRYGYKRGDFPVAEGIAQRTLALPFFPGLPERDVHRIADAVTRMLPSLARTNPKHSISC